MISELTRKALAVDEAYMALGNERLEGPDAVIVRNRETPNIWDANHVNRVTASTPEEIERLFEHVEREFEGFRHRRFHLDQTSPTEFEARLALNGYEKGETLVLLLEGELTGEAKPCEVRPVESAADWQAYESLYDLDWHEFRAQLPGFTEETARQMMVARRTKSPPAAYWLACVDGQPRSYLASWGGVDGVGYVEDLFTHPEYRHRGLAAALIHHCVAQARSEGAGPIVICADPNDTPKSMYASLGFRPVAVKRNYLKRIEPAG